MRRLFVAATAALLFVSAVAPSWAQESRPSPPAGGGMPGQGGQAGQGEMMGGHPMMGGGMMEMHAGRAGIRGRDHLEHLMVHNPKAAARIMRFRADMLRAIGEVLQRHADEIEKPR